MPRDRNGSYEPAVVPKQTRRLGNINSVVLSLYSRGMTTRDIEAHLAEVYGASVSQESISDISEIVVDEIKAWRARPPDERSTRFSTSTGCGRGSATTGSSPPRSPTWLSGSTSMGANTPWARCGVSGAWASVFAALLFVPCAVTVLGFVVASGTSFAAITGAFGLAALVASRSALDH